MNSSTLSAAATRFALRPIALLAVIVLSTLTAAADRFQYGDLYFETTSDNTCEVAGLSSYDLSEVTIPELAVFNGKFYNVTAIGNRAFGSCSSLTSITIPSSVTTIGDGAFGYCSSLTSINIPNSVTTIGDRAFYECSSLTSITIPNSVTTIGDWAFSGCSSLTSIDIPNSVTTIGDGAFHYCSSLTSIDIPNSVTTIGESAFGGCSSLTSINVDAANPSYSSTDGVLFNKDATAIITHPAAKPNSSYDIPNSVTTIGVGAFTYCWSLTSIDIPNSVTTIGDGAFRYCFRLTSITIPNSVMTIGDWAFDYCSSLTSINIPNSVMTIGKGAFCDCSSLTSVNIPNSVTTIGEGAFCRCSRLTSIDIPNSVTTIGDEAFLRCSSLTSIYLGNGVTTIGDGAFSWCKSLADVYNYALTPQNLPDDAFSNFGTLHVHKGYKDVYSMAEGWSKFNIVDDIANIAFEKDVYSCAVGGSFTPVVTGIDADELEWASSDSSVLYIDPVYHLCLGRKDGIAYITVTQKTVPHNSATVRVLVGDVSGITPLTTDSDAITDVYSLDGRRTTSGQHNGVSIVRTADGKTRKVMKN